MFRSILPAIRRRGIRSPGPDQHVRTHAPHIIPSHPRIFVSRIPASLCIHPYVPTPPSLIHAIAHIRTRSRPALRRDRPSPQAPRSRRAAYAPVGRAADACTAFSRASSRPSRPRFPPSPPHPHTPLPVRALCAPTPLISVNPTPAPRRPPCPCANPWRSGLYVRSCLVYTAYGLRAC